MIGCSQYGIISSSACKAFICFLLHVLLFGGRLCALVHIWSNKAWFYMLLCSARSKIEVIRIKQTAFHFERLKLCLISAVVVLLVQIWRYYLPRSCFSCVVVGRFSFVHNEVIIYSCVVVVIVDMVGMFHIILLWYNPYIIIYNPYMV